MPNPTRTVLTIALAAMPFLLFAPSTTAGPGDLPIVGALLPEASGDVCPYERHDSTDIGYIAITGRGSFSAQAQEIRDGCGGDGCDDWIDGSYLSGGSHSFFVWERGRGTDRCNMECYIDDLAISITDGHGEVWFDDVRQEAYYACNYSNGAWAFGGTFGDVVLN